MRENYRCGYVYLRDEFVGIISETEDGYEFSYDETYLSKDAPLSVSLTLPVDKNPFISKTVFPFFEGLIPEGWLLEAVVHNWKLDSNDRFGLLLCACHDCIGDVHVEVEKL